MTHVFYILYWVMNKECLYFYDCFDSGVSTKSVFSSIYPTVWDNYKHPGVICTTAASLNWVNFSLSSCSINWEVKEIHSGLGEDRGPRGKERSEEFSRVQKQQKCFNGFIFCGWMCLEVADYNAHTLQLHLAFTDMIKPLKNVLWSTDDVELMPPSGPSVPPILMIIF